MTDRTPVPPSHLHVPPRARTQTAELARLAVALHRPLYAEQLVALDAITGVRADGRPASMEACLITPRQNMKSFLIELFVLARLLRPDSNDKLIVWSAHEVPTAQSIFQDIQNLIAEHPWLARRVVKISQSNGKEGIEFAGGRWLRFRARIATGGRGLTGDVVVLDEAFALVAEHMGALVPIMSTRPNAALLYGSSAGRVHSAVLRGVRDRGRAGGRRAPAYAEWSHPGSLDDPGCAQDRCLHAPDTPGCTLDDEDAWRTANPAAAAGRITIDYLRDERDILTPEEFARERLGWWEEETAAAPIPVETWAGLADPDSTPEPSPVMLALDVSEGLRSAAVVAVGRRPDGLAHVEVLAHAPGTAWVAEWLADKADATGGQVWALGGTHPVSAVLPDLAAAGVEVSVLSGTDFVAACGAFRRLALDGGLRHLGDPKLAVALAGVITRAVGDGGWVPSRRSSPVDVSPLIAAVVGVWALTGTTEVDLGTTIF